MLPHLMVPFFLFHFKLCTLFSEVTSAPGLRFAKLHQDVYSCHDVVLLEFSIVGPNSCLQFSASAELTTLSRQHVLCPVR